MIISRDLPMKTEEIASTLDMKMSGCRKRKWVEQICGAIK